MENLKKNLPTANGVLESPSTKEKCPICHDAEVVYACKIDGGIDYSRVVPCKCQKDVFELRKTAWLLQYCELPYGSEHYTFETYEVKNESNKMAYETCLALAENRAGAKRFITLAGGSDLGKTHLAIAICRKWLDKKLPARYGLVPLLLNELKDGFAKEGEESYRGRFDRLCKVPLLILDDLGTEKTTSWALEQLQILVDYRYMNGLPLVVTTNRPLASITGDFDEEHKLASARIASRLQRESWCQVIVLSGKEHRFWEKR